jgi:copper oxidase (laccase) domain-containing protein
MANYIKEVEYIKPGIGNFNDFSKDLVHGFSWGQDAKNMQFSLGDFLEVRSNLNEFFSSMKLGDFKKAILVNAEHKNNIIKIDEETLTNLKPTKFGISIKCDAAFTKIKGLPITVKPADCTTAIISAKDNQGDTVTGIVHTGRRGVELGLPISAIQFICKEFDIEVRNIKIGIVPHLFQMNRKFEHIDDMNPAIWKGYIKEENGYFYPDETELAINQYLSAGIQEQNIFVYDIDTYESAKNGIGFSYKYHYDITKSGSIAKEGRFIVATAVR